MTLVILAAGMGSRYGGLKQVDPITQHKEFIIDYSIYDAIHAGFDHIVFLIKKENLEAFKETIGNRIAPFVKTDFAFQSLEMLPQGFTAPAERTKPWGTAQAIICCKDAVGNDNFAIINADDFYGRDAFIQMAKALRNVDNGHYCMAGYVLNNTLPNKGSVTRGICRTENGKLISIEDYPKVYRENEKIYYLCNGCPHPIDNNSVVSMNLFGFAPDVFDVFENEFKSFLADKCGDYITEFSTAVALAEAIQKHVCSVDVFNTSAEWTGVTYAEDKPVVIRKIKEMTEKGIYPDGLWSTS